MADEQNESSAQLENDDGEAVSSASNKATSIDREQVESSGSASADDDFISLDDIDALIQEADPDFAQTIDQIEEEGQDINPDEIDIEESVANIPEPDEDDQKIKKPLSVRYPRIFKYFKIFLFLGKPCRYVWEQTKYISLRLRNYFYALFRAALSFVKEDLPVHLKNLFFWLKSKIKLSFIKIAKLKDLDRKQKVMLFIFSILCGLSLYLGYKLWHGGFFPRVFSDEIKSFEQVSNGPVVEFKNDDLLRFYDAFPQPDYSFQLKKLVVNLKQERPYLSPPFAMFVFFLKVDSPDTGVEVKDREPQILDIVQRVVEEYTYRELSTVEGIRRLQLHIKNEVNRSLNQGQVRSVYIDHKVLKPGS